MAELSEEEKYIRKAALLKKALADADQMDAMDTKKAVAATNKRNKPVYEHTPGQALADDEYDGMEDMLGDDTLPTDWDPEIEDPPHEAWYAHIDTLNVREA